MLNKLTENILKLNLGAFNLRLPWQRVPASSTHPTKTEVVIRDAGGQRCFKALTVEWRACQSIVRKGKSAQKRERERKFRLLFRERSQPAASLGRPLPPPCRISHRYKHRWVRSISGWWQRMGFTSTVCSYLFCFYFKSPGESSVTCAVQNLMRGAKNTYLWEEQCWGNSSVTEHLLTSHGASPGNSLQHQNQTHSLWVQSRPGLSLVLLVFWDSVSAAWGLASVILLSSTPVVMMRALSRLRKWHLGTTAAPTWEFLG